MHETGNGIDVAIKGGDAGKLFVDDQLAQLVQRRILADRDHPRPRRQHFAHGLIAKRHHGLDQLAVPFLDNAFFFAGADQRFNVLFGGCLFTGDGATQLEQRLQEFHAPGQGPGH